jgi:hypothetical protein
MKRKAILLVVALSLPQAAMADVYVKVDANGNATGGAIMCDAVTCGAGSEYSRLTLQPGEHYQLQGTGQAGIGNNNPGVEVRHEATTNEWVVTNTNTPTPVVERFTTIETRNVQTVTNSVQETSTAIVDTATVTIAETSTAHVDYFNFNWETIDWSTFNWDSFFVWLTAYIDKLLAVKP